MKIHANFREEVEIDPKDVIKKLIEKEIGQSSCIFEKDSKFYYVYEESAGCHSIDVAEEITKEQYEYVKALQLVQMRLG